MGSHERESSLSVPRWLLFAMALGLGLFDIGLWVLDYLERLDYIRQHYPKMYGFLLRPETMLTLALASGAISIVGWRRGRAERSEANSDTRRIGSIKVLKPQFWSIHQGENITYLATGQTSSIVIPICNERRRWKPGEDACVEAELRFFWVNDAPLQIVSRGMWVGEETGAVSIRVAETKYLILAICQAHPANPDFFSSVEDLRGLTATRGQARRQAREALRVNPLPRRFKVRVRLLLDGGRRVKLVRYTITIATHQVKVRQETLGVRWERCRAGLSRSTLGGWYRRVRRTRVTPAVPPDPKDDPSSPLP